MFLGVAGEVHVTEPDLSRAPGQERLERLRDETLSTHVERDHVGNVAFVTARSKLYPADCFAVGAPADRQRQLFPLAPGSKISSRPPGTVVVVVGIACLLDRPAEEPRRVRIDVKLAERSPIGGPPSVEHERRIDADQRRLASPPLHGHRRQAYRDLL